MDYKLYVSSTADSIRDEWIGDNYAFQWLGYIAENEKHLKKFRVSNTDKYNNGCEESFWKRADFFNLECIKSLNLFDTKEWNTLFKKQQYIWDDNYLATQLADNVPFIDINEDQYLSYSFSIDDVDYPNERWMDESTKQIKSHPLFFKNRTFTLHEAACLISGHNPITTFGQYTYVHWLKANPSYEEASDFIYSFLRENPAYEYLDSNTHLGADTIKMILTESNIFIDGFNDILSVQKSTNFGQPSIQQTEPSIKNLNNQISELRKLIAEKDVKIKNLESFNQKDDTDLINLIFDESVIDRYAPDLISAIKLWEHIYITSPKNDSHTNKADTWLEKNTGYDTAKKQGSASKIREITAPFINWSTHRDKAYKK